MEANVISINLWQTHVLSCPTCGAAKDFGGLCQAAQNFWKPPEIPQNAPNPSVSQNQRPLWLSQDQRMENSQPQEDPRNSRIEAPMRSNERPVALVLDGAGLSSLASQVSERIMVKTSSGASIAVPMEKTSSLISFSTAPGVVIRMPERDIAVYGEMKDVILRISQITEIMGAHVLFQGEMQRAAPGASRADAATTAIDVRRRTGLPIEPLDQVYGAFGDVASRVLRLGDTMGRLMTVDAETRRVIRSLRLLGIRMRGELERSVQGELVIDESSREVIQEARAVAIDLQGEIERRVGT
jgi:hypothetical protein